MDVLAQLRSLEGSKIAQDIATAFLGGFAASALTTLTPDLHLTDPGLTIQNLAQHLSNPDWLYLFFNTAFGAALGCAFGLRLKSAFDSLRNPVNTTLLPIRAQDLK